jgi:hypothetical protein
MLAGPALAQSVQQSGTVTRNHLPVWVTSGVQGDGGSAADSPISTIGATGPICSNSARQSSGGWNSLCLQANTSSAATITLQNYGTASAQNLQFVLNGTTYPFPGSLANITIGVTPVVGGTSSQCLYVSSGVVGQQTCTLSAITSLTGDGTATGPGVAAFTLATVNSNVGTFGSGASVPIITVNGKGLITTVTTSPVSITVGSSVINSGSNQGMLYNNGGVLGNLTTLGNAVLVTSAGGVPVEATTLPSGLTIPGSTFTGTLTFPDAATWTTTGISKVAALSAGSATIPSAGNINVSGQYQVSGSQIAASNLSNGATGSGAVVLAASPTLSGTVAGSLTFSGALTMSGNSTFSAQAIYTGTSAPASAGGQVYVMGTITSPTLANTGQGAIYDTLANGLILEGDGSTNDVSLFNKSGTLVAGVPTGTTKLNFPSLASGTCSSGLGLDSSNNTILISCPGAASSIQVGTTTIVSGSSGNIEFNNAGTLGEVTPGNGVAIISTTLGLTAARRTLPVDCIIASTAATTCANGGSAANNGTYTTPANALYLEIEMVGPGGGGAGGGSGAGAGGGAGGSTTFSTFTATSGSGGTGAGQAGGGAGGTASGCEINDAGQAGAGGDTLALGVGQMGGMSFFGGAGPQPPGGGNAGLPGVPNTGGGGSGGSSSSGSGGTGGGAGGYCRTIITSPSATYSYTIGTGGAAGTAGTGGAVGGVGAAGRIVIRARFGS